MGTGLCRLQLGGVARFTAPPIMWLQTKRKQTKALSSEGSDSLGKHITYVYLNIQTRIPKSPVPTVGPTGIQREMKLSDRVWHVGYGAIWLPGPGWPRRDRRKATGARGY